MTTIKRSVEQATTSADGMNYVSEDPSQAEIYYSEDAQYGEGAVVLNINGLTIDIVEMRDIIEDMEHIQKKH